MKNFKVKKQSFASRINKSGYLLNAIMIFRARRRVGWSAVLMML